ncbi:MAG: PepSY-associated TM helix domain-containing protein [Planctomycetes bacterium]|nr:PepSY-associated TM helix domain-containing protein [Planctomycetota bacterium]
MKKHGWRWWLHAIHRDVGYLCVGLTVIYAVSGIAVNHVQDWNPNYSIEVIRSEIEPIATTTTDEDAAALVLERLQLSPDYRALFEPAPNELRILRRQHTIDVDLRTGAVRQELVTPRPGLHEANSLHLNHPKRAWTWIADAFAVALILLAVTGMFLIKGKKGITGRGAWLTAAGIALPLFFLWLYA